MAGLLHLSDHSSEFLLRLHVERQSSYPLEIGDDRVQRTMGMERRALQTDEEMALRCNPARQGHAHSRFTDPCFAHQQDHLTLAFARGLPSPEQQRKLALSANHFRQIGVVCSIEAAFGRRLAQHAPDWPYPGQTFQIECTKEFKLEHALDQPACATGNSYPIGWRKRLQPCGQRRCFSDNRFFPGRALAQKVTNNTKACRDTRSHIERYIWH